MDSFENKIVEDGNYDPPDTDSTVDTNRTKMIILCRIAGSYMAAAQLIAKQTQRPLSVDSIKAWTCNPLTKRSRPCPNWAVTALERSIKRTQKSANRKI